MSRKKTALQTCCKVLPCCLLALHASRVPAQTEAYKECMLELMESAASDVTVGDIRETCKAAEEAVAPATTVEPAVVPEAAQISDRPPTGDGRRHRGGSVCNDASQTQLHYLYV